MDDITQQKIMRASLEHTSFTHLSICDQTVPRDFLSNYRPMRSQQSDHAKPPLTTSVKGRTHPSIPSPIEERIATKSSQFKKKRSFTVRKD